MLTEAAGRKGVKRCDHTGRCGGRPELHLVLCHEAVLKPFHRSAHIFVSKTSHQPPQVFSDRSTICLSTFIFTLLGSHHSSTSGQDPVSAPTIQQNLQLCSQTQQLQRQICATDQMPGTWRRHLVAISCQSTEMSFYAPPHPVSAPPHPSKPRPHPTCPLWPHLVYSRLIGASCRSVSLTA